jgi:ribonuclease P protein component
VFKQPKRSRDQYYLILACRNQLAYPRLGLIVSKKRLRRAVSRNRIKRIVRNDFRLNQHQLPAIDIVVLAYQPVETENNTVLVAALAQHWQRLNKIFSS